jgi:hypothetical protein
LPVVAVVFVSDHDEITMIIVVIVAFPQHNLCWSYRNQSLSSCKTSVSSPARYLAWSAKTKHCDTKTTFAASTYVFVACVQSLGLNILVFASIFFGFALSFCFYDPRILILRSDLMIFVPPNFVFISRGFGFSFRFRQLHCLLRLAVDTSNFPESSAPVSISDLSCALMNTPTLGPCSRCPSRECVGYAVSLHYCWPLRILTLMRPSPHMDLGQTVSVITCCRPHHSFNSRSSRRLSRHWLSTLSSGVFVSADFEVFYLTLHSTAGCSF